MAGRYNNRVWKESEKSYIIEQFMLGISVSDTSLDLRASVSAVNRVLVDAKSDRGVTASLTDIRKGLIQRAIRKSGGSYKETKKLLRFELTQGTFDRVSNSEKVSIFKMKKASYITCENCQNKTSSEHELYGRPCKAVDTGFPANDEDGDCISFVAIDKNFKKGISNFPDTGFSRLERR